jgi:hypothetical protein
MSVVGILSSGALPQYMGSSTVYRNDTDAKNIIYAVYEGSWQPGDAMAGSRTAIAYVFYRAVDGVNYVEVQNSSSSTYNAAGDGTGYRYLCNVYVWNNNGASVYQIGPFGNAYPYANPWVFL